MPSGVRTYGCRLRTSRRLARAWTVHIGQARQRLYLDDTLCLDGIPHSRQCDDAIGMFQFEVRLYDDSDINFVVVEVYRQVLDGVRF